MTTHLQEDIRDFIKRSFYVVEIPDDASLLDTGTIDSTGVLEIISFIEQQFAIRVGDREITPEHFDSIARIAAFVERKLLLERGDRGVASQILQRARGACGAPDTGGALEP